VISARVDVVLEKSLEEVFEVVVNFADYPRWNPFVVKVEGATRAELGATMKFFVRWPTGGSATSGEVVTRLVPPSSADTAEVVWRFTGPLASLGLVKADRLQRMTRLSPTRTRYESEEVFTGLLARFIPLANVQAGFEAQARAMATL
jgi:hypothetical protein